MHFDFHAIVRALPFLMDGLAFTVQLTAVACIGGLILGTGMAVIRQLQVPVAAKYEGAKALGLSTATMYGSVIIPQVLRATAPIIVTQTIILFQDTALVYVLSLHDFLGTAAQIAQRDGKLTEFYTFVAVVYLVLCSAGSELAERLRRKTPGTVRRAKSFRALSLPRP